MMTEHEAWSETRLENLKLNLRQKGITAFVFDLDDTLKRTNFTAGRMIYLDAIRQLSGQEIDAPTFMEEWFQQWKSLQKEHGVHPWLHRHISQLKAEEYGLAWDNSKLQEAFTKMWQLTYDTVPEATPGAEETLDLARQLNLGLYIVTHAEEDWTKFKLSDWPDRFDGVYCVSVAGSKDSTAWRAALEHLALKPEEIAVAGDNIEADIEAARALGVRYLFRMNHGRYPQGQTLPDGAVEINDLRQMLYWFE